jgi:hypothetical protein
MSRTARSVSTADARGPRQWLAVAADALRTVSDRPQLWVAGALGWAATAAPIALLIAVVPVPSISDLTFLGSRAFVSSIWPWNVIGLGAAALALVAVAIAMVALADAGLRGNRVVGAPPIILRAFAVTLVTTLPTVAFVAVAGLAAVGVARDEFVAPGDADGGPIVQTVVRLAPLLALVAAAGIASGAYGAAARVAVMDRGAGVGAAFASAPTMIVRGGWPVATHIGVVALARAVYLVLATVLLAVLWAPIGAELAGGAEFDAPLGALLVGFVAIWICLVLGGGALHAWGSMTWTALLVGSPPRGGGAAADRKESPSIP